MRVAIVGAGIAGLQQGRALQKRGIDFHIYEAAEKVGGVWRQTAHLQGAQVTYPYYEFPEFPWPTSLKQQYPDAVTPPGPAVQRYIEMYAKHFSLDSAISLSTTVTQVSQNQETKKWTVLSSSAKRADADAMREEFDYIVLATGSFITPRIPDIQDRDFFKGREIIARELTTENLAVAQGKRVVVIGSAKSALDVAGAAGEVAESVKMLSRQAHFFMPLNILGIVPCNYIKYSRFGVWLTTHPYPSSYPSLPGLTSFFHAVMRPVKRAIWKSVGWLLPWQSRLPPEMIPTRGAEEDTFAELGTINAGSIFLKHLRSGKIKVIPGQAERFTEGGLQTASSQHIAADLVIYATGFDRKYDYLSKDVLKQLHQTEEGTPLYRDTIPPHVQGLAFVGSEVITYNAVTTSGLQAEWLAALLQGDFVLPNTQEMEADIARKQAWRYSFIPAHNFRVGRIAHCHQLLWDELMCDRGLAKFRKGWGLLQELWQPYNSADYRKVFYKHNIAHEPVAACFPLS